MSFVILLALAFITFNLMPEMLDNISGIADLVSRKSPEERRQEALKKEKTEREKKEKGDADDDEAEDEVEEETEDEEEDDNVMVGVSTEDLDDK